MLELIDKAIENNSNEHNNLLKSFKELAMNSSDLKVYEKKFFVLLSGAH